MRTYEGQDTRDLADQQPNETTLKQVHGQASPPRHGELKHVLYVGRNCDDQQKELAIKQPDGTTLYPHVLVGIPLLASWIST